MCSDWIKNVNNGKQQESSLSVDLSGSISDTNNTVTVNRISYSWLRLLDVLLASGESIQPSKNSGLYPVFSTHQRNQLRKLLEQVSAIYSRTTGSQTALSISSLQPREPCYSDFPTVGLSDVYSDKSFISCSEVDSDKC